MPEHLPETSQRTRSSTFDYVGNYVGDFTGNYSRLLSYAGNFVVPVLTGVGSNTLQVISHTQYTVPSTGSTSASFSVTVPTGTKSIVVMGGVGTNGGRQTRHTTCTIGGTSVPEVSSKNNTLAEYTFDSAIFMEIGAQQELKQ